MVTTVPIYIFLTDGFMEQDAGPLLFVKEELGITLMYMKYSL